MIEECRVRTPAREMAAGYDARFMTALIENQNQVKMLIGMHNFLL